MFDCKVIDERPSVACLTMRIRNLALMPENKPLSFKEVKRIIRDNKKGGIIGKSLYSNLEVLVVTNRKHGGYTCPGGKVDTFETLEEAAKRELKEEVGVEVKNLIALRSQSHIPHIDDKDQRPWNCLIFYAEFDETNIKQQEKGTVPSWVRLKDSMDPDVSFVGNFNKKVFEDLGFI